jgi:short-subunit dehydrogenase
MAASEPASGSRREAGEPAGLDLRALVTGASGGIGAAFARALAARGERLVLVDRRQEQLRVLAEELGGEGVALPLEADLSRADAALRIAEELDSRGLGVDLLVNNAGLGHTGRFDEAPVERLAEMVDVNVRGLILLTRRFLPGMILRRRGRVINVASMSSFQPVPFLAVYAASKAFVLSFTEALATELKGTGVRVQALCPGNVPTGFQQVAGTQEARFTTATPSTSAEDVVAVSLAALERGRLRVIPGIQNRLSVLAQGWLPRGLVRRVAGELFRPR